MTTTTLDPQTLPSATLSPDDLAEVLQAYSAVAERLQTSHETLQGEVVRLRKELKAKNEQLERSKRLSALGEMAAGIAHEIRNPLAAIQLYAEMVEADLRTANGEVRSAETQDFAIRTSDLALSNTRKIADAVRGLSAIVNDVLSFARRIEPTRKPTDTAELARRVIDAHRPALQPAAVEVILDLETDTLDVDADLLQQALLNLVRNAVDAMAEQPDDRALLLSFAPGRITVADTGPGLPAETADRIFNPFFTTRSTGTGLGLAIVHRIVDAHGGSIAVHNDEDTGGAVFTLTLPTSSKCEAQSAKEVGSTPPALGDSSLRTSNLSLQTSKDAA